MKKSSLLRNVRQALRFGRNDSSSDVHTSPGSRSSGQAVVLEARISLSGGVVMRIPIDPDNLTELVSSDVLNGRSLSEANGGDA